jgi:hypothetical protein
MSVNRAAWDTTVYCSHPGFSTRPATYKVAAEWTGGEYSELKTYGFADDACLPLVYQAAVERVARFHSCEGETLGELRIYRLDTKRPDAALERAIDLEASLRERFKS